MICSKMYFKRLIPFLRLTCLAISVGQARTKMVASMTKIECPIYAPHLIKNVSCHVNRTERGAGKFSVEFSLTESIKDVTGKYTVSQKQGSSISKYLSTKIDYCKVLAKLHANYLLKTLTAEIRKVSNLPLKCPFEMNKLYYIKDFSLDTTVLPSYLPDLDFISDVQVNCNKRKVAQVIIHGSLAHV